MELLAVNLSARVRRATLHGRDHLVAPLTLIVPGVLNGSKGPLYYPPEEIARDPAAWNGMPIVVNHPQADGVHTSAREPDVLNRQGVGQVYKARIRNGKLVAEGWFDVERLRAVEPRVLAALEAGRQGELSTGLYTDNEPAQNGARHNGRPYSLVARNYRPDHLAILPDQIGACSVRDGCGVLVNAKNKLMRLARDFVSAVLENAGVNQPHSRNTGKFKHTGAGTGRGEVYESAQKGGMVITDRQRELGRDAAAQATEGDNPPSWAVDGDKWDKAKQIVAEKMPDCDEPYACVTYIYEHIGGVTNMDAENAFCPTGEGGGIDPSCSPGGGGGGGKEIASYEMSGESWDSQPSRKELEKGVKEFNETGASLTLRSYRREKGVVKATLSGPREEIEEFVGEYDFDESKLRVSNREGDDDMALKPEDRKKIVDNLIANCAECGWKEADRETLNDMSDETLARLDGQRKKLTANATRIKEVEAVEVAARRGFGIPDEVTVNAMPAFIKEKIAAKDGDCVDGKDKDGNPCGEEAAKNKEKTVSNERKPLTERELVAAMSPETREDLAFARAEKARQKAVLIQRLIANVADEGQQAAQAKRLQSRSLDDLRADVALLPPEKQKQEADPLYYGQAAPVGNVGQDQDVLELPVMNFEPAGKH